jgi:AcrR family transcriptional regulator
MSEHVPIVVQPLSPAAKSRQSAPERLQRAGTHLIAAHGIDGVNTNTIARAAGLGVGTFYANFRDKHALHRAIVVRAFDEMQKAIVEAAASARQGGLESEVRATVAAVVDFAERNPDLFHVAFSGPMPTTAHGAPVMGFSSRPMERRLSDLQTRGDFDPGIDPAVAARGWFGQQNSVLSWWLGSRERPTRDQVIETLSRLHPAMAGRTRPGEAGPTG